MLKDYKDNTHYKCKVSSISKFKTEDNGHYQWKVNHDCNNEKNINNIFDAIVLTIPTHQILELNGDFRDVLASSLNSNEDNLLTRGVKIAPATSPPMTHLQMETIIKKLYVNVNKPFYFDCLREVIRRKNGGTLNSLENEMVDVHFIRPCENDKGLYISYLLHELFFKRRTQNIFLERDSEKT